MPVLDGVGVAQELRRRGSPIPTLILSALDETNRDTYRAARNGCALLCWLAVLITPRLGPEPDHHHPRPSEISDYGIEQATTAFQPRSQLPPMEWWIQADLTSVRMQVFDRLGQPLIVDAERSLRFPGARHIRCQPR
jgi:hypothetical protein